MQLTKLLSAGLSVLAVVYGAEVLADPAALNAKPQNDKQRAMLKVVDRWQETYNNEVEKMILETYDKDANVNFTGGSVQGHEQFMRLEKAIVAAAPGRRMRIDRVQFIGDDTSVVEAVILDTARPDFFSPWCALLTFRNGKIVQDRTYLEANRWPGIEVAGKIVTPGGLGSSSGKAKP